ncbi:MAG: deoxyribose-phosphate aldolase [Bacillota bacterium]
MADVAKLTKKQAARMIDYSILAHHAGDKEQLDGCNNVKKYKFGAFYVLPYWIPLVVSEIGDFCKENEIEIGTGISFPWGINDTKTKLVETEQMIKAGCTALDIVANIAALKDKKYDYYFNEIKQFVDICKGNNLVAKVIIELCYLTDKEIETATGLVIDAEADYVKTSTGQGITGRPNLNDVSLMAKIIKEKKSDCKLKVAGVAEPREQNAYAFIQAGVDRIGTRAAVRIVKGLPLIQAMMFKR